MTPAEALAAWQNSQISESALKRILVGHAKWQAPVAESAVGDMLAGGEARFEFSHTPEGEPILCLMSSDESANEFRKVQTPDQDQHFLTTTGQWFFQSLAGQVSTVVLDPYLPYSVSYSGQELQELTRLADAMQIEEILREIRTNPEAPNELFSKVKSFPAFTMFGYKTGEEMNLCLAPDSKNRALAAILTFDDCIDAYQAEAAGLCAGKELLKLVLDGERAFRNLAQMDLQGYVFNPCGPVPPVAFIPDFAKWVTDAP